MDLEKSHREKPRRAKDYQKSTRSGAVLIIVLGTIALLMTLVLHSRSSAVSRMIIEERLEAECELRAAVEDCAWAAMDILLEDIDLTCDHSDEPWASEFKTCTGSITTMVSVIDESRFFNVNNMNSSLAMKYPDRFAAILRDTLTAAGEPQAAHVASNIGRCISGEARNAAAPMCTMESPAELATALGNPVSDTPLAECLTVIPDNSSRPHPVNVNTASEPVLTGLLAPGHAGLVEALFRLRLNVPLTSGLVAARLPREFSEGEFSGIISTTSRFYSILARAEKNGIQREVYVLVHRKDNHELSILRWVRM